MNRTAVFVMFAFIGFVIAFAAALPTARSAAPVEMRLSDRSGDLPLGWVQQALSDMPFLTPGRN